MPKILIPTEDSFATIAPMVVQSVVKQLMFLTGIDNVEIIVKEPLGAAKNSAANSDPDADPLKLETGEYVIVEYRERLNENIIGIGKEQPAMKPVVWIPPLGIEVTPVTLTNDLELTITLRSKSFNKVSNWLDRWRANLNIREAGNYHNIVYNYTLPDLVVAYLWDVYTLSEQVAGYGKTYKEFTEEYFTRGIMGRKNLSGDRQAFAINVESIGNLGVYTENPGEITRDKDRGVSEIQFGYKLTYDKVSFVSLEYQLFIHNQRISSEYNPFFERKKEPINTHTGFTTFQGGILETIDNKPWIYQLGENIFYEPLDTYLPTLSLPKTKPMLIVPIKLEPTDLNLVLDLHDLPPEKFDANFIPIMEAFYQLLVTAYAFPITVGLFAVGEEEKGVEIECDSNLVITTVNPMDLRKRYYLQISMLVDYSKLPLNTLYALCNRPNDLLYLLQWLNPTITMDGSPGNLKLIAGGTVVDITSLYKVILALNETDPHYREFFGSDQLHEFLKNNHHGNATPLVMAGNVIAKRRT